MLENGFMSEITDYRTLTSPLGSVETRFLMLFGYRNLTAYQIFLMLQKAGMPMGYPNVRKRIKRLEELGLIEFEGRFKRNAIIYRLATRGLFEYLLLRGSRIYVLVLWRHRDNVLLKTLLYQFFEQETVLEFSTMIRTEELSKFISKCCHGILTTLEDLRSEAEGQGVEFSSYVNDRAYMINSLIIREAENFVLEIVRYSHHITTGRQQTVFDMLDAWAGRNKKDPDEDEFSTAYPNSTLAQDRKFIKWLTRLKNDFDRGYQNFLKK